jgi:hypothetical protein
MRAGAGILVDREPDRLFPVGPAQLPDLVAVRKRRLPGQLGRCENLDELELDSVHAPRRRVRRHPAEPDGGPAGGGEGLPEDTEPAAGVVGRVGFPDEDAVPPVVRRAQGRPHDEVVAAILDARARELVNGEVGGPPVVEVEVRHR